MGKRGKRAPSTYIAPYLYFIDWAARIAHCLKRAQIWGILDDGDPTSLVGINEAAGGGGERTAQGG